MKRSKIIQITKEVLENFNEQIKKYELDSFTQSQILKSAALIIEEESIANRNRAFNDSVLTGIRNMNGRI